LGSRELKVDEFLFRLIICYERQPGLFGYYAPAIYTHKETTAIMSDQVNIFCNIEGKLGTICPLVVLFPFDSN